MAFYSLDLDLTDFFKDIPKGSMGGHVAGYRSDEVIRLKGWLTTEGADDAVIEAAVSAVAEFEGDESNNFVILKSIRVDESLRGNGYGNQLMEEFMMLADGSPVFAILDTEEAQLDGFSLSKWYEGFGFDAHPLRADKSFPLIMCGERLTGDDIYTIFKSKLPVEPISPGKSCFRPAPSYR